MAVNAPTPDKDSGTTDDPVDSPPGYEYSSAPGRDVWTHQETGLEVEVRSTAKPSQMHSPETASRDTGYRGWVYGEDAAEALSRVELGHYEPTLEVAAAFMQAFPDGEYEPVVETIDAHGEPRWRQLAGEDN